MRFLKIGILIIISLFILALIGPWISGQTYFSIHLEQTNYPPSLQHWFGTDDLGRDVFTRICYGARISLFVGFVAAFIDLFIGLIWGASAAFFGHTVDTLLMRIADTLYSLPYLLIVILLTVVLGSGLFSIIIALSVLSWVPMARIVRGEVLKLKGREYILAGQALGFSNSYVLYFHLIPNIFRSVLTTLILSVSSAIFSEAFLSFLGIGVQAPIASLGTMANEGLPALRYYPWRLILPSCFISLVILSLNLIAEGIQDVYKTQKH